MAFSRFLERCEGVSTNDFLPTTDCLKSCELDLGLRAYMKSCRWYYSPSGGVYKVWLSLAVVTGVQEPAKSLRPRGHHLCKRLRGIFSKYNLGDFTMKLGRRDLALHASAPFEEGLFGANKCRR